MFNTCMFNIWKVGRVSFAQSEFHTRLLVRNAFTKSRYELPLTKRKRDKEGGRVVYDDALTSDSESVVPLLAKSSSSQPYLSVAKQRKQILNIYKGRILRLVEQGNIEMARSSLTELKNNGILPNSTVYNAVISGLAKTGDGKEALKYFKEMCDQNVQPNSRTYCSVLYAFSKVGNEEGALDKVREIVERAKKADNFKEGDSLFVFNAAMKAYVFCGDPVAAFELYDDMILDGVKPDAITASTLILACQQNKQEGMKMIVKVLSEVMNKGIKIAHVELFNNILLVCRDCHQDEYINGMLKCLDPDFKRTKNSIVAAFLKVAEIQNCQLDMRSHQLLLYMAKSTADVSLVLESIQKGGIFYDFHFLSTLFSKYVQFKQHQQATEILIEYARHYENPEHISIIKKALSTVRFPMDMYTVVKILETHGYEFSIEYVDMILKGIRKGKNPHFIQKLLKRAEEEELTPSTETIKFVQDYTADMHRRRQFNSCYIFFNGWLEKWHMESMNDLLHDDPKYDHL